MGKYEKMWQEGKMPMQQLAKELIEKGIISADLDYKSEAAVRLAIKYNDEQQAKKREKEAEQEKIRSEKRKNLPPLESWLNSDKTVKELYGMGYSYVELTKLMYCGEVNS